MAIQVRLGLLTPLPPPLQPKLFPEAQIDEAKESYVDGRCTLAEFEEIVRHLLWCDFPVPLDLGLRTIPSMIAERWFL